MNAQEYFNNDELYKGEDIGTNVINQISDFATDSALIGTNSVSSFIKKLMGSNSSGISLSSISSSLPDLSVDTGLNVSQLSNLSAVKSNTLNTRNAVNTMAGGRSLANLRIKKETSVSTPQYKYVSGVGQIPNGTISNTTYSYYSEGGFTGFGQGLRDHTGFKQAGIVHEDEWVSPKWMIDSNPGLFSQLEAIRQKGSFADGGFTSIQTRTSYESIDYINKKENIVMQDIKELAKLQVRQTRKIYKLFLRLTNNGVSMPIEGEII